MNVRRFGSIQAAVAAGWLKSGVLFECVRAGVPFVLGGSVRDDGPLPDVITDTVAAADAMREQLAGVEVALGRRRQHCTPSPPATCSPPRSRRSAWTSTKLC